MNRKEELIKAAEYMKNFCEKSKCWECALKSECYALDNNLPLHQVIIKAVESFVDKKEPDSRDSDNLTIKVKYFGDVQRIEKISVGNWIDLRCAEDVEMKAGEYKMFPLGVAMELPNGYEAIVAPRSSTFRKYGIILVNSIGIIDESYCGDNDQWQYLAYAMRDTKIPKNERICQFRIIKHQPEVEFVEVETLGNEDRGGIGSTGRV